MPTDAAALLAAIGRRVSELREERGLTQEELAAELDVSVRYMQSIEAGRQNLSVRSLVKLANALGVAVAALFKEPRRRAPRPRGRPKTRT